MNYDEYLSRATHKKFSEKELDDLREKIDKKYNKGNHTNIKELEADRHSVNKVGKKHAKKALQEMRKLSTRDDEIKKDFDSYNENQKINHPNFPIPKNKTRKNIDKEKKRIHKFVDSSNKYRFKAMDDEEMRDSKIYKNI